ncbi:uncharacterized protein N7525_001737 [Penicillium rubens]|jgi:DNA-directed RNA polymerase subunit M/transcription elongation factor TFIIS|uniref:uncharacterized protein n=1 Tax=Penicillium rubens TaxID=1108849 RepID=UPI002A59C96C|nr:uncharacterized protein N7525_001737 [Penicillium rubens]KAJ5843996.1 hypothetical protein N7525_001737 [Penicillium rubens]
MTPRYEVPRALSCPCLPTPPGFEDILTFPVCPHCANILAIAKIDTEIKVICRTCPYTCSIGDIAPPVPDSDDDNNKVDSEKVDSEKVDSEKVDSKKVDSEKVDSEKVDDTNVSS